ncbi:MAG: putative bifunctional diguanylate cyclase/phosphodiesterase [Clostridia bacterium]
MWESMLLLVVILIIGYRALGQCDPITKLPNRKLFIKQLNRVIRRNHSSPMAIVMMEFACVKNPNESNANFYRNERLRKIGSMLQRMGTNTGVIGNVGKNQFAFVVKDYDQVQALMASLELLKEKLLKGLALGGIQVKITIRTGIGLYPENGGDGEQLLEFAHIALQHSKAKGLEEPLVYRKEMNEAVERRCKIEDGLANALKKEELVVYFHPQFEIRTGNIRGFEALVRWNHPELGLVKPCEFLAIAEEKGLSEEIGEWVLWEACRKNKEIQRLHFHDSVISVNVSARLVMSPDFLEKVKMILQETGLAPSCLELEIAQSRLNVTSDSMLAQLQQLGERGIKLTLDGFGNDDSAIRNLKRLPLATVKVARGFIQDIASDRTCKIIMESMITVSHKLGVSVAAEGVETYEQLHYLRTWGCDYLQGSLLSKPLPYEELPHLFAILQHKPHPLKPFCSLSMR